MRDAFAKHGIEHLSASSINLFVAQPSLWAASYLLKKRTPVGPAAHRGSAIEHGVEAGLFDVEMPAAAAADLALQRYHGLTRFSSDPRVEKEREAIADTVKVVLAELRQYGVPEKCDSERQHRIEVTLSDDLPHFLGFLDFKWPEHNVIVDLKTTARVPSEISPPHCRQGAIYWKHSGNADVRFGYASTKKMMVYRLENGAAHVADVIKIGNAIGRFLSLSDDGEKLTRALYPDETSFYWGDASAAAIAKEIWAD
jgi:hypothetical protein